MKKQLNKKGFTLIEVVLVLAIGGLIFLLAFLAFQQVSRNRRDTQRRTDVARSATAFQDARNNTSGNAAPTGAQWLSTAQSIPNFNRPGTTTPYSITTSATEPDFIAQDSIVLVRPATITTADPARACIGLDGATATTGGKACRNVE